MRSLLGHAWARTERLTVTRLLDLPPAVQRRLAGPPVVRDGQRLALDVQLALRLQRLARMPGPHQGTPERGRAALRRIVGATTGEHPIGSVRDLDAGGVPARLYVPRSAGAPGPLLVWIHGGGFFCGDLESHDGFCRLVAERAGVRVLAVDYRLAPEHPFPVAHDDALAAYRWAVEHRDDLGAADIGVGGDSAGGNLAAYVAHEAARAQWPCAVQLLVYPMTDPEHPTRSAELFGEGFFLTTEFIDVATERYGPGHHSDPRLALVAAELPDGLAPAMVVTAGYDPLRDEGETYAAQLREAGVPVRLTRFEGLIHGFLNMDGVGVSAPAAIARIGDDLASAFAGAVADPRATVSA
ncbi:alpha/beta hydrolase fold domain-containing protein [Nocardioides sp. YIM 123512]|uniref:Alpha/beta hydrolase fold domain-containing protein n=2 Tax=Nocardioides flavescens TaxID=2691959 RepID=A0A6L7F0Y9_9ACTN|nr:alpha/beta hydrolase fold domain-containing protein [Nocardioides flavescens]